MRSLRHRCHVRRVRRVGFTLIEVMVSLGVMMVGTMAVIALQQQSVRANVHARQMTIAMQIAQRWMERLKEDAHTWTSVATDAAGVTTALANTVFLKQHLTAMSSQPGEFKTLLTELGTWERSNAFDQYGRDMPPATESSCAVGDSIHTYCASYRPAWIWYGQLMRVDVRVWWARDVARETPQLNVCTDFPVVAGAACGGDDAKLRPNGPQYDWYHVVYLPGAIRVNEVRR